jgi:hypothetical protein
MSAGRTFFRGEDPLDYSVKRKWQRFPASAQVRVQVLDDQVSDKIILGASRDVSAAGVFILTQNPPPVGTKVKVFTRLATTGMILENCGEVVRLEADGFAVRFDNVIRTKRSN